MSDKVRNSFMKMSQVTKPKAELVDFLELIVAWHCSAGAPFDRVSTAEFIEDREFLHFLQSVTHWCNIFGLSIPSRSEVVKALYQVY